MILFLYLLILYGLAFFVFGHEKDGAPGRRRLSKKRGEYKEIYIGTSLPETAKEERKALTLPEVRTVLAGKCAAGFGTQVKALIESYGASTLKEVPAEKYEELLEAVAQLGGDADAG